MATFFGQARDGKGVGRLGLMNGARRLVLELAVVVGLVSYSVEYPRGISQAESWRFVLSHPLVLLHVLVGTVVLVEAIGYLIGAIGNRDRLWCILAVGGLACVLLAYAAGEMYVATQDTSVLTYMSLGWFGAIMIYGFGWYRGHARARAQRR